MHVQAGDSRMPRLLGSGASVVSPYFEKEEFKRVLSNLQVDQVLGTAAIDSLYSDLGVIIGKWMSELEERSEAAPIAKALLSTSRNLSEVSRLLSGHEDGLRTSVEIGVTTETIKYLELDPTLETPAPEFISAFARAATRIAHASMVAYKAVPDRSAERGRPALDWYDDFTALLLELADWAGVAPTLWKDPSTGGRRGWLLEASQALETFLWPAMRSPSPEACGKRLERSRRRLRESKRQKPRAR
jgi:hypothetical protein